MAIKYNELNVDEKYSGIFEPNLYYNPVLVPGVTCTDKYETGPAGQIYVHKLTTSAVTPASRAAILPTPPWLTRLSRFS